MNFFHNTTKMRRIINHINTLKGEGEHEIEGQEALKKEAYIHFKNLLTIDPTTPDFENFIKHIQKRINGEINSDLLK